MGDRRERRQCWVDLFLIALYSLHAYGSPADQQHKVCVSQGGRFPRFVLEGQAPKKSAKGPDDLIFCRVYRKKTCCSTAQTHAALLSVRKLSVHGEGSDECLKFWEAIECSICDPRVGVTPGPPVLCSSLCESTFKACGSAFFSLDPTTQVLTPCGPKDIICQKATQWASNGTEFCLLAGFSVTGIPGNFNEREPLFCFDGSMNSDTQITDSRPSKRGFRNKARKLSMLQRLQEWMRQFDMIDEVIWAVGGLVLTAGLTLLRQRRRRVRIDQRKADMTRFLRAQAAMRLEAKHRLMQGSVGSSNAGPGSVGYTANITKPTCSSNAIEGRKKDSSDDSGNAGAGSDGKTSNVKPRLCRNALKGKKKDICSLQY